MRNYNPNMSGAYSDIETRDVIIITETHVSGYDTHAAFDAPVVTAIEQEDFTPELARETLEYC